MKPQFKICLALFFCIMLLSIHSSYAIDRNNNGKNAIELKVDSGGYYTASSCLDHT